MFTNIAKFEHTIGTKFYHFLCDSDAPLPDAKEAMFQFLKYIGHIEDQVKAAQAVPTAHVETLEPVITPPVETP